MENIILVGYGGHAKSVADSIERTGIFNIVGYTDIQQHVSDYKYLGTDDVLEDYFTKGIHNAAICIGFLGKGKLREQLYNRLKTIGYNLPIIVDPTAVVSSSAGIGEGTFIGKNAVVNTEVKIGKMGIINTQAVVEHECNVGDYTHVAVAAVLCGGVTIGKNCLIGANATVLQYRSVGDNSIVAAGTVLTKNISDNLIVTNNALMTRL